MGVTKELSTFGGKKKNQTSNGKEKTLSRALYCNSCVCWLYFGSGSANTWDSF